MMNKLDKIKGLTKKSWLILAVSIITLTSNAQTYYLSKGITVGCYNANPLTDLTKKIELVKDDKSVIFKYGSINCTKEYKALEISLDNGNVAYLDKKEKKGLIVMSDNRVALVAEKDSKYQVLVGGHLDKKEAKGVSTETLSGELQSSMDKFDAYIKKAEEEAKEAEKLANILPIPNLSLTDEWGFSGLYYLSELSGCAGISSYADTRNKYVQAVYMHLDKNDNYNLKAYFTETGYDKFYFDGSRSFKAFKAGNLNPVHRFSGDNMNNVNFFKYKSLTRLEDGLFLVNYGGWFRTKGGCSEVVWSGEQAAEKYILLGKDKARIDELMQKPEEIKRLAEEATRAECLQSDALEAAEKPMPSPSSMNTAKLSSEATAVTLKWAQARWAQELQYVFVTGKEWNIHRNQITGIIVARGIWCVAVMKEKDGTCKWEEVYVKQDYDGANYGSTYFGNETTVIVPVDCTTAMKHKK
ncbi:hypothetical protein K6119_15645 [Paracrocinitomix mangrovi]|uniref:hypothetical protein n=1 Tax=Paracrocinitomix mangrovi TaxID=2862509 RepID=UPI001C8DA3F6|nr:hypothetical protein [Paracrocinitomix mangrovi]UKN01163.1 hypothetical protein K6119_15645 [Paracrocinitomix mangrovi]